ncbi:hypothetical protein J6590_002525 [Homalodisca vitripennis]|nr:hypothetical protein J6590_002525 [Homalodisca vitripennis]
MDSVVLGNTSADDNDDVRQVSRANTRSDVSYEWTACQLKNGSTVVTTIRVTGLVDSVIVSVKGYNTRSDVNDEWTACQLKNGSTVVTTIRVTGLVDSVIVSVKG